MAGRSGEMRLAVRSFRCIIRNMRRNAPRTDRSQLRSHQLSRFFRWDLIDKRDQIKEEVKNANNPEHLKRNDDNQRLWQEVQKMYYSCGERSVEETAKLIGVKLPHDKH
jgi:hypothetical protein